MAAGHRKPKIKKHQDLIEAIELMKIGDPPFRYDIPEGETRNVLAAAARYLHGTWRHIHNGQLWVIKYE